MRELKVKSNHTFLKVVLFVILFCLALGSIGYTYHKTKLVLTETETQIAEIELTPGPKGVDGVNGEQGLQGIPGEDGHTPVLTINEEGYWCIDSISTGVKAQGPQGEAGKNGSDGKSGIDGVNGKDGADGKDGQQGPAGKDGQDGKDGKDGLILVDTPIYQYEFRNWDGTLLDYGFRVKDGTPAYTKEMPTKVLETGFNYKFIGWDKEVKALSDHIVYTAQFELESFDYTLGAYPRTLVTDTELITALDNVVATDKNGYLEYEGFKYYKYNSSVKTAKYKGEHYYRVEPIQWTEVISNINARITTEVIDEMDYSSYSNIMSRANDMSYINKIFAYEDISINQMLFTSPSFSVNMINLIHTEPSYKLNDELMLAVATDYAKARGVTLNKYYVANGDVYSNGELYEDGNDDYSYGIRFMVSFAG